MNVIVPLTPEGRVIDMVIGKLDGADWLPDIHPMAYTMATVEPDGIVPPRETGEWQCYRDLPA